MTPETNMDIALAPAESNRPDDGKRLLTPDEIKVSSFYLAVKRLADIVFSLAGIAALSWLFLIVAILIIIDDPHGSPFFSQPRVGKDGRVFRFWKFRSMVVNADKMVGSLQKLNEKDGPVFKIKDDPRITRLGKFLRKSSIDELPQLWNVLKGDMSIVGPRPPLPREVEKYTDYQRQRLMVTPGLTCYWQTQKNRDNVKFAQWVDLDIQYIRDRSLLVDLKLIFRTFMVVFTGQGH